MVNYFNSFNIPKYDYSKPYIFRISKFEGSEVHFNYKVRDSDLIIDNTLINNFNDTSYINQIPTTEVIINNMDSVNFLIHLFNELNLFV